MSNLSAPHFHNEEAAYPFVEARVWPIGPHCGGVERVGKMGGKSTRIGTYKCYQCRKPFTVKVGTVFEASHVPLHVWLQAIYLICGSKKGISSNQLHRILGVTLKTAWFMSHRVREAMRSGDLASFGSGGGIVEADETYIGNDPTKPKKPNARGGGHKHKVLALIDRKTGRARSMMIEEVSARAIGAILRDNMRREAMLVTDEAGHYIRLGRNFAGHEYVNHGAGEYGWGEIHTNCAEGYFSIFKRGMGGIYQHFGKKHLHRYVAEFEFRYNNHKALGVEDGERADNALSGIVVKRLTYQTIGV